VLASASLSNHCSAAFEPQPPGSSVEAGIRSMESETAISRVEALFAFIHPLTTSDEIANELKVLGLTLADLKSQENLFFIIGIAHNIRRACDALELPISPHQSLTLAKNMIVGGDHYRNGVPLSDHERDIALRLTRIHLQESCRKNGKTFTEKHEKDCRRWVQFRERGLTIGHKMGEASGCFRVFLILVLSTASLIAVSVIVCQ
jgi:hypothetical protein